MRLFFSGLSADARYKNLVFDLGFLPPGSSVIAEKCEKLFLLGDSSEEAGRLLLEQLKKAAAISDEPFAFVSLPFDKKLSGITPDYSVLENSEMSVFAEKLVGERRKSIDTGSESFGEENKEVVKNEIVIRESRGFGFVKGKIKKIAEKGFTEGFGG